ncbi:MAG: SpoIVB peptidase precursor [Firmicutes bacterium ADurb.Bin248]|nr:MAG: SpoIVB peptidase precursor [Firmicutes bacterium ADurb.Bin248]HOG00352.1 SpoIVB peptidase [Clostridia bacterium]HPK16249.1 SpoIVB peptidase [Clostridia bacterium]
MRYSSRSVGLKSAGLILCALITALNCLPRFAELRELPNDIYVDRDNGCDALFSLGAPFSVLDETGVAVSGDLSETLGNREGDASYVVRLFGIPIKQVNVHVRDEVYVMPGGETVGISLYCDGVLVVGLGDITTDSGAFSPAAAAGIKAGDVIQTVDGTRIESVSQLVNLCSETGRTYAIGLVRGGESMSVNLTPRQNEGGGNASMGMWVRESSAGIGTLSFYVMSTLRFGALGHAVTDADTGTIIPAREGEILQADVVGIVEGKQGMPGEIKGTFGIMSRRLARIEDNTEFGVYGTMTQALVNPVYPEGLPLAYPEEITTGEASILASIDNGGVREYRCEIVKIYQQPLTESKGMVIRITDEELISKAGGIVQGMSGSPIIQNGRLVGAVTHVFINDPLKGYGIYALWMYECSNH